MDLSGRLSNHDLGDLDPCLLPSGQSTPSEVGRGAYERQKHVRLSEDEVDELVAEYQAGLPSRQLRDKYGISRSTLTKHLERRGVDPRGRGNPQKLGAAAIEHAYELYSAGASLATVGEGLGVDASTVMRAFRRSGLATRPRPGS